MTATVPTSPGALDVVRAAFDAWQTMWNQVGDDLNELRRVEHLASARLDLTEMVSVRRSLRHRGVPWSARCFAPIHLFAGELTILSGLAASPRLTRLTQVALGLAAWRIAPLSAAADPDWAAARHDKRVRTSRRGGQFWAIYVSTTATQPCAWNDDGGLCGIAPGRGVGALPIP